MRVKNQYNLQPTEFESHAVTLEDSHGNIIFAAIELDDGTVVAAKAGDADFTSLLAFLQIDKVTTVTDINPRSVQEMRQLID